MGRELFGTDGIRGLAGKRPLDPATVHAVGVALGRWCKTHSGSRQVVVGMDTRESGPWIAAHAAAGLASEGIGTQFAGVLSTPGIAYLTKHGDFAAGVMISASHNPFHDNGIKVFAHDGYKLPDAQEEILEDTIRSLWDQQPGAAPELQPVAALDDQYVDFLVSVFRGTLDGVRVAVDCWNGAASHLAPILLERLGATVYRTGCEPDGRNINLGCGALHTGQLSQRVVELGAHAGFAFDGDADRCMAVSESGKLIDGDAVLYLCARHMRSRGELHGDAVVATVMSNIGLELALQAEGINLVRTAVGDKYVLEEMRSRRAALGGEQSGHVIFLDQATTGDGLLTAIRVLEAMRETGKSLEELAAGMTKYPQTLVNVAIRERRPISDLLAVQDAIVRAERELNGRGCVLVRFSGTEPLARVMVEGPTLDQVDQYAGQIAQAIRNEIGA
ncbi:MAG: phosphoglucosamine mutase [Acidobacteria bacterium]|nr:phosphoglucosamine mutase [Acidobacteriota bacterium]